MTNKEELRMVAPRRASQPESPQVVPTTISAVPVISRLPSLTASQAARPTETASETATETATETARPTAADNHHVGEHPAASVQAGQRFESFIPPTYEPNVASHRPDEVGEIGVHAPRQVQRPHERHDVRCSERPVTSYPWHNLLVGIGFAGILLLAAYLLARSRPAAVSPAQLFPSTVHLHLDPAQVAVPPQQLVSPSTMGRQTADESPRGDSPVDALTDAVPAPADDPLVPPMSAIESAGRDPAADPRIALRTREETTTPVAATTTYPSTKYPTLAVPSAPQAEFRETISPLGSDARTSDQGLLPPTMALPAAPTADGRAARLDGNIQAFKK